MSVVRRVARVGDDEFDDVFADFCDSRYVEFKRNVSADMFADGNAVEFHGANHIHGVEVNDGVRLHEIGLRRRL